jgi:hypothetical protein
MLPGASPGDDRNSPANTSSALPVSGPAVVVPRSTARSDASFLDGTVRRHLI